MKKMLLTVILSSVSIIVFCQQQATYTNPILSGFYPDPSICKAGNDYYLINSSFAYFPGLPVFHSTDLANWTQIGNAMDRKEQLDLAGAGVSRGLFAPAITYHNGLFYIICTLIDKGGNFVITAKDPKGPWSNPTWIPQVNGIDPSIFFDEDGKSYIVYNSIPPDNKSVYNGHRTIRINEFDAATLKVTSENKILVNGGTDIAKHPVWIEGPHLYKKDGWYYLMCAEGGTAYEHSEVVFRSKTIAGPFIPYENNPILTQRHLDKQRQNPITTTGHADLVQASNGKWYAVFLGCRPYADNYFNTGRETFMAPVEWKDGWPVITTDPVQYKYPVPLSKTKKVVNNYNGNFYYKDDFNNSKLAYRYIFLRNPDANLFSLTTHKGALALQIKPQTASGKESPAFIGFRQSNLKGYAATEIDFTPAAPNEKAGLLIFQNETHFYFLCKSIEDGQPVVQLYKSGTKATDEPQLLASQKLTANKKLQLKIVADSDTYAFYYGEENNKWKLLQEKVDGKFLSTEVAGGFVGSLFALYGTSNGKPVTTTAIYNWFEYKGNDDVYKPINLEK